jgi:hypothetical protein
MLVLMVAVVASCGGGSSDRAAERLSRLDDQASVAAATGALTRAGLNGGDFFELTLHIVLAVRQAMLDGVAPSWINQQIAKTETAVSDCSSCLDLLATVSARV